MLFLLGWGFNLGIDAWIVFWEYFSGKWVLVEGCCYGIWVLWLFLI